MTELTYSGLGNVTNYVTATGYVHIDITKEPHWILSIVGTLIIILTNFYIAVAFIRYANCTKVFKKKSRRDVNGGLVTVLAIVAVIAPLFRFFGTLAFLIIGLYPEYENGCEIAYDICVAGFGLSILPTYAFLWARQRAFYGHPSLGHMFGTCVGVFSKISLSLIILTTLSLIALGTYPVEYKHGMGGCVLVGEVEQDEYRTYIYAVVMISSQLVLLGLFVHPLRLHAQGQKGIQSSGSVVSKSDMSEQSSETPENTDVSVIYKNNSVSPNEDRNRKNLQIDTSETKFIQTPKQYRSQSLPNNNNPMIVTNNADHTSESESESDLKKRKCSVEGNADRKTSTTSSRRHTSIVSKFGRKMRRRTTVRSKRVYSLIRRILYLSLISIFSDLIAMVINGFLIPDDIPQTYSFVLYDFDLLINIATVLISFENWRTIMATPFKWNKL